MPAAGAHPTLGGSPFPPIADYGFLSDCEVAALVAPSGSVEWMCLPRMDGPSIFAALLDRDAGSFRLGPADVSVPAARRYLPGTMVLETTWDVPAGWAVVRDALLVGPWRVAVGTALAGGPPHRSQRALLTHWAPASGTNVEPHLGIGMHHA
ncbi:MAG: trehalase-like domain-containing protein, partial [Streptosporangiaceae bacterium]